MQALVLCAQMEKGKLMRLSFLASSLGIRIREVLPQEYGCTLGMLCGIDPMKRKTGAISREIMVMAFFPDALMDQWLRAMRAAGDTVALKAVLTPYNRLWTAEKLALALQAEHAQLKQKEQEI